MHMRRGVGKGGMEAWRELVSVCGVRSGVQDCDLQLQEEEGEEEDEEEDIQCVSL
jgi:hypothetical protein